VVYDFGKNGHQSFDPALNICQLLYGALLYGALSVAVDMGTRADVRDQSGGEDV
jgi:hypothetical protein